MRRERTHNSYQSDVRQDFFFTVGAKKPFVFTRRALDRFENRDIEFKKEVKVLCDKNGRLESVHGAIRIHKLRQETDFSPVLKWLHERGVVSLQKQPCGCPQEQEPSYLLDRNGYVKPVYREALCRLLTENTKNCWLHGGSDFASLNQAIVHLIQTHKGLL